MTAPAVPAQSHLRRQDHATGRRLRWESKDPKGCTAPRRFHEQGNHLAVTFSDMALPVRPDIKPSDLTKAADVILASDRADASGPTVSGAPYDEDEYGAADELKQLLAERPWNAPKHADPERVSKLEAEECDQTIHELIDADGEYFASFLREIEDWVLASAPPTEEDGSEDEDGEQAPTHLLSLEDVGMPHPRSPLRETVEIDLIDPHERLDRQDCSFRGISFNPRAV